MTVRVDKLFVHPIKSLAAKAVERAHVGARGFDDDRRYMLVDDDGVFVTQRSSPAMVLMRVALGADGYRVHAEGDTLVVPRSIEGPRAEVRVWDDTVSGVVADSATNAWFSDRLGRSIRLVYMPDDAGRPVSFADKYSFLVVSRASMALLESKVGRPVEVERFRPNLVLSGVEAHAEDEIDTMSIGSVRFRGAKRCVRCSIPNVDPMTGIRSKEPTKTLLTYRQFDAEVMFGMNLDHEGTGIVAVGDQVTLGRQKQ